MRLIPEFSGHASSDYTSCLAFLRIVARCLPLEIGLSRESCYFGCLVPVSRDGTFSRVLLFLHFWVGINPRASLNENIFTDFNKVAKDLFFIFYFLNKINLY